MIISFSKSSLPRSPWFVVLAFILLVAPFALNFHLHYPDEMYYSDAAIRMIQNQDYLTTYLGNGELRFNKPILTYWAVLAGFKLFGVSAFSSRLFFLLAGGLIVFLVNQIAQVSLRDGKIAFLASLIAASHPVLIFSSTRSIPDILLGLFITLSALGYAGLLKYGNNAPKKYLWLLYMGLGLAFEVKGLPAVAMGGIGILYLLLNPWRRISWKKLLYLPAIILGVLVAVFWFVSMYVKFGATYLDSFFGDQVGDRVSSRLITVLKNFGLAIVLMIAMFFPWFLFGFKKLKARLRLMASENPAFFWWVILWVISIILMSALVTQFYERYLLPVVPLAAVVLAWLLTKNTTLAKSKGVTVALYFFFALNLLVLLMALFINWGMDAAWYIYPGLFLGMLSLVLLLQHVSRKQDSFAWLSLSILLLFYHGSFITHQLSLPHQGKQVARLVKEKAVPKSSNIAFWGHPHIGSKIRIGLGAEYVMWDVSQETLLENPGQFDFIICGEEGKNQLDNTLYRAETASLNWDPELNPEMLKIILSGNYREVLAQKGKRFYWMEKNY